MSSVPILNWKILNQANLAAASLNWRTLESNTHLINGDLSRLPIDRPAPYMVVSAVPVNYRSGSAMRCEIRINGFDDRATLDVALPIFVNLPRMTLLQKNICPECDGRNLTEVESRCYDCASQDYYE